MNTWTIRIEPEYEHLGSRWWEERWYWKATGVPTTSETDETVTGTGYAATYEQALEQAHHYADNVTVHRYAPNRYPETEHTKGTHDG